MPVVCLASKGRVEAPPPPPPPPPSVRFNSIETARGFGRARARARDRFHSVSPELIQIYQSCVAMTNTNIEFGFMLHPAGRDFQMEARDVAM